MLFHNLDDLSSDTEAFVNINSSINENPEDSKVKRGFLKKDENNRQLCGPASKRKRKQRTVQDKEGMCIDGTPVRMRMLNTIRSISLFHSFIFPLHY